MSKSVWIAATVAAFMVLSCGRPGGHEPKRLLAAKKEQVNLPPRPNLNVKPLAEKTPDGAFTVAGFLRHAREMVGKPVTVKGFVQAVETCPVEVERCDTVPHVVLVDDPSNTRHKLFVVADPPDLFFAKEVEARSTQTMSGTVALWSPDGRLINLDGLLVVKLTTPVIQPAEPTKGQARK